MRWLLNYQASITSKEKGVWTWIRTAQYISHEIKVFHDGVSIVFKKKVRQDATRDRIRRCAIKKTNDSGKAICSRCCQNLSQLSCT